jgi:hypothetical protein
MILPIPRCHTLANRPQKFNHEIGHLDKAGRHRCSFFERFPAWDAKHLNLMTLI